MVLDNYLRPLINHDKDILTKQGKILTNFTCMLMVAENYSLTIDFKGHWKFLHLYTCPNKLKLLRYFSNEPI